MTPTIQFSPGNLVEWRGQIYLVKEHRPPHGWFIVENFPEAKDQWWYKYSRSYFAAESRLVATSIKEVELEDFGWIVSLAEPGLKERLVKEFQKRTRPGWTSRISSLFSKVAHHLRSFRGT